MIRVRPAGARLAMLQVAAGAALFLAIDCVAFRSGWYLPWIAPDSAAASVMNVIVAARHAAPGKPAILVMGDSRVSEGFSAPLANATSLRLHSPYDFVNASAPGTTPRVWYYLLREISHSPVRIAAVVIALDSFHDNKFEVEANRIYDIAFLHPFLRLTDLTDFAFSFPSAEARRQAAEAVLFEGLFYKADIQALLDDPKARFHKAMSWQAHSYEWTQNYQGRPYSLAGLTMDLDTGALVIPASWAGHDPANLKIYASTLRMYRGRPPDNATTASYREQWLTRLAVLCHDIGARLFILRIPRGPLHFMVDSDTQPTGVVARLAQNGQAGLLPAGLFDNLEQPEYFFDQLHMNKAGRSQFSAQLAAAMIGRLN